MCFYMTMFNYVAKREREREHIIPRTVNLKK